MTVHAPTDVRAITIPTERGGCGQPHEADANLGPGEHFAVNCPDCEPVIMGLGHGWAGDPLGVSLTPDERAHLATLDDQAKAHQAKTWSDPDAVGKAIASALANAGPRPGSLLDQIRAEAAALDDAGKAELAAALGLIPAPAPADEPPAAETPAKKAAPAKKTTPPQTHGA